MELFDQIKSHMSLSEWTEFLQEKINDGEQISKGKSPTDISKEQKKDKIVSKEVEKKANGAAKEVHYDTQHEVDAQMPGEEPAPVAPAPGSQVKIGKKEKSDVEDKPVAVKVGKEKEKVDMKPKLPASKGDSQSGGSE